MATTNLKRGLGTVTMNSDIVEAEVVMESIWPELGLQTGTGKHSAEGVTNGLMGTFTRSIMMRRIWSCGFNTVASSFKQFDNGRGMAKFTTKIKTDIAVRDILRRGMLSKPTIDEVNGWSFGTEGFTIESATVVVHNQAVTGLTINALKTLHVVRILGQLNKEAKIDREPLTTLNSTTRVNFGGDSFMELSMKTDRALIKFTSNRNRQDTTGVFVSVRDTPRVQMTKVLVPLDTELITGQTSQHKAGWGRDIITSRDRSKTRRRSGAMTVFEIGVGDSKTLGKIPESGSVVLVKGA